MCLEKTMYPFCVFFIWITFSRRDYELIRQEVGRLLKSEAFNNGVKIENVLDEGLMMVFFNQEMFLNLCFLFYTDSESTENKNKVKPNDSEFILKQFENNRMTMDDQKSFVK